MSTGSWSAVGELWTISFFSSPISSANASINCKKKEWEALTDKCKEEWQQQSTKPKEFLKPDEDTDTDLAFNKGKGSSAILCVCVSFRPAGN